jgi:hypothetical protein
MPTFVIRRTPIAGPDMFCAAIQWIKAVALPAGASGQPDGRRADR